MPRRKMQDKQRKAMFAKMNRQNIAPPHIERDSFGFETDPYGREEEDREYRKQAQREYQSIQDEYYEEPEVIKLTKEEKLLIKKYEELDAPDKIGGILTEAIERAERKKELAKKYTNSKLIYESLKKKGVKRL